jgi:hypothetical protein
VVAAAQTEFARGFKSCASRNLRKFVDEQTVFHVSSLVQTWAQVIHALENKMQKRWAVQARPQGTYFIIIMITDSGYPTVSMIVIRC